MAVLLGRDGMRTWGRGVAVALVATALAVPVGGAPAPAGAVAGGPAAPAQAGPSVTLSPATDVPAGSQVEVTLRGFPAEAPHGLMQCDASILDDLSDRSRCVFTHISLEPVTDPFTETIHVHGAFDVPDGDGDGGQ